MLGKILVGSKVSKVSEVIAEKKPQLVKCPISNADVINTMAYFHSIAEFPHVAGTIACTHIIFSNPRGEDYLRFMNQKVLFSIV